MSKMEGPFLIEWQVRDVTPVLKRIYLKISYDKQTQSGDFYKSKYFGGK